MANTNTLEKRIILPPEEIVDLPGITTPAYDEYQGKKPAASSYTGTPRAVRTVWPRWTRFLDLRKFF